MGAGGMRIKTKLSPSWVKLSRSTWAELGKRVITEEQDKQRSKSTRLGQGRNMVADEKADWPGNKLAREKINHQENAFK